MKTSKFLLFVILIFICVSSVYTQTKKSKKEDKKAISTKFIHWYGQAAFRLEDGEKQIYIDPFKLPEKDLPKADFILITHSHFDHYSVVEIDKIKKPETIILIPADLKEKFDGKATVVEPGKEYKFDKITINTIRAYNIGKKFHPKENNWVGYIVHLSDAVSIYHAGDSDATPEMEKVKTDIALLPIGGKYTMTAIEAAGAVNVFKPKIAIPMHYGDVVGSDKDAETFKKMAKTNVEIKTRDK